MRVIVLPRRALAWLALVVCCGALLWYAFSGPAAVTTGVAVYHREPPVTPHPSGTPAPAPGETARALAVETAMERERARSERLEWLRSIAADPGTSTLTRDEVQRRVLDELDQAAKEEELGELLKSEGFGDSVVVLNDKGLTISVHGRLLDQLTAARLGELASRMTGLPPERIVLVDGR